MAAAGPKPSRPGFARVGRLAEVVAAPISVVRVAGKPVAVFRRAAAPAGDPAAGLFAREMACKHQNADLTRGTIAGGQVTCPRHGWRYDLATGACLDHDALPLRAHEVVVEDGWVFVALTPSAGPRPGV